MLYHTGVIQQLLYHTGVLVPLPNHTGVINQLHKHTGVLVPLPNHFGVIGQLQFHTSVYVQWQFNTSVKLQAQYHTGGMLELPIHTGVFVHRNLSAGTVGGWGLRYRGFIGQAGTPRLQTHASAPLHRSTEKSLWCGSMRRTRPRAGRGTSRKRMRAWCTPALRPCPDQVTAACVPTSDKARTSSRGGRGRE